MNIRDIQKFAPMIMGGTATVSAGGSPPAASYLFDTYAGTIGYSFRQLSDVGTAAVIIRRSSDDGTAAFGWDGSGNFDTAGAATFIGAGTGYIHTFYDQSGNGKNATQTTTSLQPQYGTAIFSGKPSATITSGKYFSFTSTNIGQSWSFSAVIKIGTSLSSWPIAEHSGGSKDVQGGATLFYVYSSSSWAYFTHGMSTNTTYIVSDGQNAGNFAGFRNATALTSSGAATPANHTIDRVGIAAANQTWYLGEIIWFNEGTAQIPAIVGTINSYWSIY